MTKILNLSLILVLIFHMWIASNFELSHDEAYYWLYSQRLDWGFFDHPPMVGLIIKLFSFLPHSELAVRMGFILLQLGSCALILKMVPKQRHVVAFILFFAFPLASFAGLLALPDMPLMFMTICYCFLLDRYLKSDDYSSIIGLGITIALLLNSKYHGILVVFFTILALPKLFKRKSFYIVTVIAAVCFLPHVLWEFQHDLATLKYHFFERPKADFSFVRLLEYSVTQVFLAGLFVGPVTWWITLKIKPSDDFQRALKFICIGTFLFFFASTISKKFEANWTIFLTAPLIILAMTSVVWEKPWVKGLLLTSWFLVTFARMLFVLDPSVVNISRLTEFHGWKSWSKEVESKCHGPIMANTYQVASKLSFYLQKPVHALNIGSRKNQFDFWPMDPGYYPTRTVCYVTKKKSYGGEETVTPDGKNLRIVQDFNIP